MLCDCSGTLSGILPGRLFDELPIMFPYCSFAFLRGDFGETAVNEIMLFSKHDTKIDCWAIAKGGTSFHSKPFGLPR
jgi:hypothetical protein